MFSFLVNEGVVDLPDLRVLSGVLDGQGGNSLTVEILELSSRFVNKCLNLGTIGICVLNKV